MTAIGFERHNHDACIRSGLDSATLRCKNAGLQLTPVRRRVLEILLAEHHAHGAYEILDRLRDEGLGSQPPIVYRALEFLVHNGFAHKIERLNAFIACAHLAGNHSPVFLICRLCAAVAEEHADLTRGVLGRAAKTVGFLIERPAVEIEGICIVCRNQGM
ncbi:MAG: Fur family transcriptional regulator [Acidiferrobacteraceae bacterium]|nr:Fur family transcriptional regulator [Acidiferrobacteraceae bacterium]|tara:strand:+ start:68 stop:547 length:480 start_codon:yes stop_codon:yes gene_type:complete